MHIRRLLAGPRLFLALLVLPLLTTLPDGMPAARSAPTPASQPRARVQVREDGFVRVRRARLAALGMPDPARVDVRRHGRPVPRARSLDLVFLAHDTASPRSAWACYELYERAEPDDGSAAPPAPTPWPEPTAWSATRRQARDVVHGPLAAARPEVYDHPAAPTWFLGSILPGKALGLELGVGLDPVDSAPGRPQRLWVELWSTHRGAVALQARWGEHDLGVVEVPTAAGGATLGWDVPAQALPAALAPLVLRDVSPALPPAPPQDVSDGRGTLWIDAVGLRGEVRPRIEAKLRTWEVPADQTVVLTVEPAEAEVFVAAQAENGTALPAPGIERRPEHPGRVACSVRSQSGKVHLYAATTARDLEPAPVQDEADPLAAAGSARHLILAVPELLAGAQRLARHRSAHGTPSAVVPVQDVYARYGQGEQGSEAIRAFLLARLAQPGPPLEFVLLAGDATLDRTDVVEGVTIPAPMARTMYNGATAADRLYVLPADGRDDGGPAIGRLPFRDAKTLETYVDRLVAYETSPPADASRRLLRFVTSEGRFGPLIDGLLERMFRTVIAEDVPPGYDIEVTFASPTSPYLWPPPELNEKVLQGFADGCLFYTYVGHGFAQGFDSLRVGSQYFPILTISDVPELECRGTPPVLFVLACTTAIYDLPHIEGVGEALLASPQGPIAYWGATRICHPAANTLLGRSLARTMARGQGQWTLGEILGRARDAVLAPTEPDPGLGLIRAAIGVLAQGASPDRLAREGSWMYTLLGDPALRVAFPRQDIALRPVRRAGGLDVEITAPLPDGTEVFLTLEVPRNQRVHEPVKVRDALDAAAFPTIRRNHALVNDLVLERTSAVMANGRATARIEQREGLDGRILKAWAIAGGDVHQAGAVLEDPAAERDAR